ncbi:MAG TPA: DUF2169 domain-containing protein [Polyangium sp.]|nr:DUF2169 domain-containing protein [Polyangium sp.]
MDQPRLNNITDFVAHTQMLLDHDAEKLVAIVKGSFELHDGQIEIAPKSRDRGIRFVDIPWEQDKPESIAFPSDLCLRKPGTDVVVVAKAYAPGGKPVPSFDVRVEVGSLRKSLTIFGRRLWVEKGTALTAASPIAEIEMRYDYAWGGRDEPPGTPVEEARNPIGMGMVRDASVLTHKAAPNIEDPSNLIRSIRTKPAPAGIGAISRNWEPRRRFSGTYDDTWQSYKAPLLPDDFDDRFNQCASPGLIADPPLVGGETVRLLNLTPGGGAVTFTLPKVALEIAFEHPNRERVAFRPHLDTVVIDLFEPSAKKPIAVELVWRACVPAFRRMREATVTIRELANVGSAR